MDGDNETVPGFFCNEGLPFDRALLKSPNLCKNALRHRAENIAQRSIAGEKDWLIRCIECIDLTALSGDDTPFVVKALAARALRPLEEKRGEVRCAAVCVYPSRVRDIEAKIPVAAVAAGFPSGQYGIESRLGEIKCAIDNGAQEIDIVVNRPLVLQGRWDQLYDELKKMKQKCNGGVHMKTILAVGELGSLDNVYKASFTAMMAGSDFIKTSTGKENVNAELIGGLVMARAIRNYWNLTRTRVGLKPAGGIRTVKQALEWMLLTKEELGDDWLQPHLFRIGASGLLDDVIKRYRQISQ